MDDIDREAVREVIRQYRKEYRENIEPVIDKILEKVHNGQRVYEAVSDAFSETPFFTANRQAVTDAVYLAACAGYGVLPKMVTNPQGIKGKLLSESWTPDKMPLSKRLHGTDAAMRRTIIDTIQSAMTMTKSVKDIAMDLYDGYNSGKAVIHQAELPRYLDKVVTYARWASNGEQEMVQPVLDAAAQAEKLIGSVDRPALKAAYKNLIQAAKLFEPKAIDNAVHVAMEEKSRYHAERIARTEAARAWYEGYMAKTQDDADIWGYKYCLSSRHYLCPYDQCDVLANANMGYGKGIYPKGKQPSLPRHPHCMCMLQAVYHWEVDKDQAFQPEGARAYIDDVTAAQRQDLFGVKGAQEYRAGGDWQKLLRGFEGFGEQPTIRLKKEDFQLKLIEDNGKINKNNPEEVMSVINVCKIDKKIYSAVTPDIRTDEVVITENQVSHIKQRHPQDYERFSRYFERILEQPDYILEANKPNTALILKEIEENGEKFKLILRLQTSEDPKEFKNSIITFQKVEDKRYRRYLKNAKILYQRE
jgi:hypothetical protein